MRNPNCWLIELDKGSLQGYIEEGDLFKGAGEWFSGEEAASVEGMTMWYDNGDETHHDAHVYQRLNNMSAFKNLKFLSIPADAIGCIDIDSIKSHLLHLHIVAPRSFEYRDEYYEKDRRALIFDTVFPKLKTLQLLFSPIKFSNFDVKRYPSLEWLACDLEYDKSGKFLKFFKDYTSMQGYSLDGISKKDFLKNVPKNIQALKMWSITTRQFNYSLLSEFRDLKYLDISGSFTPIDCSVFLKLPALTELNLGCSSQIDNTSELLNSKTLEALKINSSSDRIDLTNNEIREMKNKFKAFQFG